MNESDGKRTIFKTARAAWLAVAVYTVILYSTVTLAFKIYVYIFDRMGKPFMSSAMNWLYVPVGLVLFWLIVFALPRRLGSYLAFLMIVAAMVYCLSHIPIPAKRFHFLEYAPLAVLIFDAVRHHSKDRYAYVWAMFLVTLVGLGDEILQGIVPNRYFGVNEVVTNASAGLFALVFIGFVMGEENYPLPHPLKRPRAGAPAEAEVEEPAGQVSA